MQVANHEPCTLIIGETRIASGKTETVAAEWEASCLRLADLGALKIVGPTPVRSTREMVNAMSEAERKAMLAELLGEQGVAAASPDLQQALAAGNTGRSADTVVDPNVVPADFAEMHFRKAKAWVAACTDVAVLKQLGNEETRESVMVALVERCEALSGKTN